MAANHDDHRADDDAPADADAPWSEAERVGKLTDLGTAIAVLTAWCDDPGGFTEAVVEDIIEGDVNRLAHLTAGLISLSGILLHTASHASGDAPLELLQGIARRSAE